MVSYAEFLRQKYTPEPVTGGQEEEPHVDTSHHVPLLASALMDGSGGIAIDHRANLPKEYIPYLMHHEKLELDGMKDAIKTGMKPKEAYDKIHSQHATPLERLKVEADLGKEGLEKYDQVMRDAAARAREPTDRPRHPHAHTTRYGLDEAAGIALNEKQESPSIVPSKEPDHDVIRDILIPRILPGDLKKEDKGKEKYGKLAMDDGDDYIKQPNWDTLKHPKPPLQMDVLGTSLVQGPGPGAFKMQTKRPANENTNVKEFPVSESAKTFNQSRPTTARQQRSEEISRKFGMERNVIEGRRLENKRYEKQDEDSYRAAVEYDLKRKISNEEWNYMKALDTQRQDRMFKELKDIVNKPDKPKADVIPFKGKDE